MSIDEGLLAWIEEALEPLGRMSMRKMMGGATLYLDAHAPALAGPGGPTIFAIMGDGELWFKSDAETDPVWDAAGCERFSATFKNGRVGTMNYRRAPTNVYDDPEEMQRWARLAFGAGLRGGTKKKPRKPRSGKA